RERVKVEDAPTVNNLRTERDLVVSLEVTLAIRVTELDHLKADRPLNTPTNAAEVPHETEHTSRNSRNTLRTNSVRNRSAVTVKLRNLSTKTEVRVQLLLRVLPTQRRE